MKHQISIKNNLPTSITVQGSRYHETEKLTLSELVPFIERDLIKEIHAVAIGHSSINIKLDNTYGLYRLNIQVQLPEESLKWLLSPKLEQVLNTYNQQILMYSSGELRPLPPRFTYQLEFVRSSESNYRKQHLEVIRAER